MSKIIRLDDACIEEIRKDFENTLRNAKVSDGKISYTKLLGYTDRKATVYYTSSAWAKQQALIDGFSDEVAWHGVAFRGDDPEKDEYFITDILVYPQRVTAATVTTDQEKYEMWLMGLDDDVFFNTRMQGHSHVNMSVYPSAVDTTLYERLLDQLTDEMFYIFDIWNKRGEKMFKIYDMAKNLLFETSDITVKILDDGTEADDVEVSGVTEEERKLMLEFIGAVRRKKGTEGFLENAKQLVVKTSTTYPPVKNGTYSSSPSAASPKQQADSKPAPALPAKTDATDAESKKQAAGKKRKGKRKRDKKSRPFGGSYGGWYGDGYDGYDDSPYSAFGHT